MSPVPVSPYKFETANDETKGAMMLQCGLFMFIPVSAPARVCRFAIAEQDRTIDLGKALRMPPCVEAFEDSTYIYMIYEKACWAISDDWIWESGVFSNSKNPAISGKHGIFIHVSSFFHCADLRHFAKIQAFAGPAATVPYSLLFMICSR